MLKSWLIKRVFWSRLLLILVTGLFVIPAYLFFLPQDQTNSNVPGQENKQQSIVYEEGNLRAPVVEQVLETVQPGKPSGAVSNRVVNKLAEPNQTHEDTLHILKLLSGLLSDYQSPQLTPDQKREISAILPEINQTAEGRNLIASFFFYEQDPELAAAMYDMILDANLKDPVLISELITRDETEFNDIYKARLIDLVADHNTVKQVHNQKIEDFLESMALHPDASLRQASVSQWAWYVNQYKGILPVLDAYVFSHSSQVREEVYEMIELDAIQNVSEKQEVILALDALRYADYLSLDEQEKARIEILKSRLSL